MGQGFGHELPVPHAQASHREISRYLVVIPSGGVTIARLFLESREQVADMDAGSEEIVSMTAGLVPTRGASGPEWDRALSGHSASERADAEVYTLKI
jgi:hypothetical protein